MLAVVVWGTAGAQPPQSVPAYDPARSFAPLVEVVSEAVYTVVEGDPGATRGRSGSGFMVSEDGLLLTNHHVAEIFSRPQVRNHRGEVFHATVVGTDAPMDITLLRIQGEHPWLALADSVRPGDRVLTFGSPLGLGLSVTAGIISGVGRNLRQDRTYRSDDYLQTDAAINQGNSGGPLVDLDGHVVGMNAAVIDNVNTVGFAIPAHQLAFAVEEFVNHGHIRRGFVGIKARSLTAEGAETRGIPGGAVVQEVQKPSPAAAAGLRPGDVITRVGTAPITSDGALMQLVGRQHPGDTLELQVLRKDRVLKLSLVLGDLR